MEKGGQRAAAMFLDALVKSVQSLCHGYLEFHDGIEIMGFINLSVDKENSVDCVLKEKVCKTAENATSFISNSYHAKPAPEDGPSGNGGPSGSQAGSSVNSSSRKSNPESRDSESSSSSRVSLKRKELEDSGEGCSKRPSFHHHHSSSSKTSHSQASNSVPSESSGAQRGESTGGQGLDDLDQVKLTGSGIVLERVNTQNCGGDESNDFDVTFIKEEYVEEDSAACDFEGSAEQHLAGDQFNSRGHHPNAAFTSLMSTVSSMDPSISFKTEVAEPSDGQSAASFQLLAGSSGVRGSGVEARDDVEALPSSSTLPYHIAPREPTLYHSSSSSSSYPKWASASAYSSPHRGRGRRSLLQCSACSAVFSSAFALSRHQQTVHFKSAPYPCRQCGKRFTRRETLDDHVNVKHMLIAKPHRCPACHLQFSQRTTLRKHMRENVCHFLKVHSEMANTTTLNSTV